MKPAGSLARHLATAAQRRPEALALRCAGQSWTFAELLADAGALGATLEGGPGPLIVSGSSLDLARHAYACSLENRPFWPVDRAPKEALDVAGPWGAAIRSTGRRTPATHRAGHLDQRQRG